MTYQECVDRINSISKKASRLTDKLLNEGKNHRDPEFAEVKSLWEEWDSMYEILYELSDGYKYVLEHPYDKSRKIYNNEFCIDMMLFGNLPEDGKIKVYTTNPNLTSDEHEVILIHDINDPRWKELKPA